MTTPARSLENDRFRVVRELGRGALSVLCEAAAVSAST